MKKIRIFEKNKIFCAFLYILLLLFAISGCGKDQQANPAVQNLAYEYFNAVSLLTHRKINASQFEQIINSINLNGVPNNIQQNFMRLKPALLRYVKINFKSAGDILFDIGSSAIRGWFGDPTLFIDAGKQIIDGFNNDKYFQEVKNLEAAFVGSLGSGGITQEWFDEMIKKVGL